MCDCGCDTCGSPPSKLNVIRHATGRDYSVAGVHDASTVGVPLTAFSREDHVEEPVRYTAYGQAMHAAGPSLGLNKHNPIPYHHAFRGFITSNVRVPGGLHPPVTFPQGYDGVTPLSLQPLVNKPYPYTQARYSSGIISARNLVADAELQGLVIRP